MLFLMADTFVTNPAAVEENNLESICEIAETASDFRKKITELFQKSFSEQEIEKRKKILESVYDNNVNALQLIQWIW